MTTPQITASISATDAKNEFGRILEKVIQGGTVVITKHHEPKAVLMSINDFNEIPRASRVKRDTLSAEFDPLLARMQTPAARPGLRAPLKGLPDQIGKAAVVAARRRRLEGASPVRVWTFG